MKSLVEITQLPVPEWQQYKALRLRALKEDPQAFGSSFEGEVTALDSKWQNRLQDVADGKNWAVFARINGQLVGMVFAYQENAEDKGDHVATVVSVYVVGEARGLGISGQLMDALLEKLRSIGIKTVKLSVNEQQETAVGLYKTRGFQIVGKADNAMGDGKVHTELFMEKQLN